MLDNFRDIKQYIDSIDFTQLIDKMVNYNGWLKEDAEETSLQYRRFLYLNRKYCFQNAEALVPSEDIDEFWHAHILDTKVYMKDCQAIFGQFLHHYPYFGIDEASDKKTLYLAFDTTKQLYLQEFGEPLVPTRSKYSKIVYFILKKIFERPDKETKNKYDIRGRSEYSEL
jgi:hypothetical protein